MRPRLTLARKNKTRLSWGGFCLERGINSSEFHKLDAFDGSAALGVEEIDSSFKGADVKVEAAQTTFNGAMLTHPALDIVDGELHLAALIVYFHIQLGRTDHGRHGHQEFSVGGNNDGIEVTGFAVYIHLLEAVIVETIVRGGVGDFIAELTGRLTSTLYTTNFLKINTIRTARNFEVVASRFRNSDPIQANCTAVVSAIEITQNDWKRIVGGSHASSDTTHQAVFNGTRTCAAEVSAVHVVALVAAITWDGASSTAIQQAGTTQISKGSSTGNSTVS